MKHDKKMEQGIISFILLNRIGQAGIFRDVTEEEMAEAYEMVKKEPHFPEASRMTE